MRIFFIGTLLIALCSTGCASKFVNTIFSLSPATWQRYTEQPVLLDTDGDGEDELSIARHYETFATAGLIGKLTGNEASGSFTIGDDGLRKFDASGKSDQDNTAMNNLLQTVMKYMETAAALNMENALLKQKLTQYEISTEGE